MRFQVEQLVPVGNILWSIDFIVRLTQFGKVFLTQFLLHAKIQFSFSSLPHMGAL